ncbi:hypothetical protein [Luteimonas sp. FCS-9]|uniref:hypothetical protein n=1 Tax=Luteimonas sp. FCS-9 TaxID=1547516 RepID=UPI00063EBBB2|nr:hypothetical protein [Luteimonas sp. FCS-9]KLI98088.1 hypothetical protein WQ56_15855 [Luteimonas sp. FCS-9]
MRYVLLLAALLGAVLLPAQARDRLRLQVPVPVVAGADIDAELLERCDIAGNFTSALVRELRKVAEPAQAPLADMRGQVLRVEIVDALWSGNWFIEHTQTLRVRGALYEDGVRVAGFNGVMQGRGGSMTSGCFQMNASFRALTWHIKRWLRDPVDGARIGQGG